MSIRLEGGGGGVDTALLDATYLKLDCSNDPLTAALQLPNLIVTSGGKIYPSANATTAISIAQADGTTAFVTFDSTNKRVGINKTNPGYGIDVGAGNLRVLRTDGDCYAYYQATGAYNVYQITDRAVGQYGYYMFRTSSSNRWAIGCSNAAESGSNVGSNFFIANYTDAGGWISNAIGITRSTGIVNFANGVTLPADVKLTIANGATDAPFIRTLEPMANYVTHTGTCVNAPFKTTSQDTSAIYYNFPIHSDILGANVVINKITIYYSGTDLTNDYITQFQIVKADMDGTEDSAYSDTTDLTSGTSHAYAPNLTMADDDVYLMKVNTQHNTSSEDVYIYGFQVQCHSV